MIRNLTTGPPTRLVVMFAIPLLIGNVFQQAYSFTDAVVVGRLIGVDALASVGAAGALLFLLIGFTWGSSSGLAIPVARAFGAGDPAAMRRYVAAGLYVTIGVAATITVAGRLFARSLLTLLATPPELLDGAATFLAVMFGGASATVAFNYLAAMISALGDSRTPQIILIAACVLNAGLALFLVGVVRLGIVGSAWATVIAQASAAAACLVVVARKMPMLRLHRADLSVHPAEFVESARSGLALGFQVSVIAVGALVLQYAINGLGAQAVAAFTSGIRVDQVACAPLSSFGVAMATYVAQNRGALKWHRIRDGVRRIILLNISLACVLGAMNILFGTAIVRLFVGDGQEAVVAMAHEYLIVIGATYILVAILFVLKNTVQGLGLTGVPTASGFMELIMRMAAGLVLVRALGFTGACLATPLAWLGGLVPVLISWVRQRRRLVEREREAAGPLASECDTGAPDRPA